MNAKLFFMFHSCKVNDCVGKVILYMWINAFQYHALNLHDNIYYNIYMKLRYSNKNLKMMMLVLKIARKVELVKQDLSTLPEHLNTPSDYYGVRIARLLVFYVVVCISLCIKHILI